MKKTIGIYGGSFSPPHMGHYRALSAFVNAFKPDKTYVIPTLIPPHKELSSAATPEERLAMCRLAFGELDITVSDMEIKRGGKSYTVLTLQELAKEGDRLLLLCGTDMLLTLDRWYMPERIFALAEIVYVSREEGEAGREANAAMAKKAEEYRARFGATVHALSCETFAVSSTELRTMLADGKDVSAFLHPRVKEYIAKCQLYR